MSYQNSGYKPIESSTDENDRSADETPRWKKWTYGIAAVFVVLMIGTGIAKSKEEMRTKPSIRPEDAAESGRLRLFDEHNRYVFEDYDSRPTFSSFLPGVAGLYGKPVWSFYVNRGQGVASFGSKSKDYPILEFNAANKAYQLTPYIGFRTFVQGSRGDDSFETEPFSPSKSRVDDDDDGDDDDDDVDNDGLPKRVMYVGPNEFEVKEIDGSLGLTTSSKYFVLPEADFASLVRRMTITNTGEDSVTLAILDGLAKMEPVGGKLDWGLKNMGRTLEGWFGVYHADDTLNLPFYRMSTEPSDEASVKIEEAGHYCISYVEGDDDGDGDGDPPRLLPIVYDTTSVFGQDTSLFEPKGLKTKSVSDIVNGPQYGDAKTSSAFAALEEVQLAPGESVTVASFYGKAAHVEEVPKIAAVVTRPGYVSSKFERARSLINDLTAGVETNSTNSLFDGAIKQMFLDNSLRGGMPVILGDVDDDARMSNFDEDPRVKVFHAFSRIHGDLERDYNAFMIDDTYFSQGPGNFRDVAQNRREDVTFLPRLGAFDVKMFLSYIQADGYEPLTVEAVVYMVTDTNQIAALAATTTADEQSGRVLEAILKGGPFRPGQLFQLIDQLGIELKVSKEDFLDSVVGVAENIAMAVYGSGYWADHWEYYLDLIESYLAIYPDGEEGLMYDNELRYFFSTATVKPRSEKYVVTYTYDGKSKHVLQLDATEFDQAKADEQEAFRNENTGIIGIDAYWQRTADGGAAFKSTPIAKLFLLGVVKFATRDAYGMGVEYEGGRPGWNDAMNGLPGMVGSGMPETYEMYLLLKYVKKVVDRYGRPVVIPTELNDMVTAVNDALDDLDESGYADPDDLPFDVPEELFNYWDVVASARENYRNNVQYYFSGNTTELAAEEVSSVVERWIEQVELGMDRAIKFGSHGFGDDGTSGIPPSYFSYDVTKWTLNDKRNKVGLPLANPRAMRVGRFPLFLEGPVRFLKTTDDVDVMKDMYRKVLNSGLRDEKLKMYKVSANLKGQSYDMGRMMAFAPGWLENESIWMHMAYKYYLELIRGGLYDEFFGEMRGGGILPFMDPDVYGRSLMECSSFLASSAFPDPKTQGRGFSARLSGSTAEFLSMWKLMFIGPKPFFLDEDGDVKMQLVPALPQWLFKDEDSDTTATYDEEGNLTLSFKLFANIIVTYHNSAGGNLYGVPPKSYKVTMADGAAKSVDGPVIPTDLAIKIRKIYDVVSIDAYF